MPITRLLFTLSGLLLLGLFLMSHARAETGIISTEIPDVYSRSHPSLVYRGLGPVCHTLRSVPFLLPCNPAFLGDESGDERFAANLFLGTDFQTIQTIDKVVNGPHSREFVESLFQNNKVIQAEASGDLAFRTRYFGASLTPYRLTYFSMVRNSGYPTVAVQAMRETTVRLMAGGEVEERLWAGLQLRWANRKFVHDEFSAFDALTERETILQARTQNQYFIEPGFAYEVSNHWQQRVTFVLSQVGFADRKYQEVDQSPKIDIGYGATPRVGLGRLDVGVNYRQSQKAKTLDGTEAWERVRLGTAYSYGLVSGIAGVDARSWSVGAVTSFWSARVGIIFNSERIRDILGEKRTVNSTWTEFSFVF